MPITATVLRVFVASPGDVKEERKILEEVIRELNLTRFDQLGVILELVKWETHVSPGISTDAQAVINEQIADDYDIFVGILWTRFGTPTNRASSGTEEEFERAYARWKVNPDRIRVLVYFKSTPIAPDQIDAEQLKRIHAFRKGLGDKGVLYWSYTTLEEFALFLRLHLGRQVQDWSKTLGIAVAPQMPANEIAPSTELPVASAVLEEEGYLDLIDRTANESSRVGEVLLHLGQALVDFTTKLEEAVKEISQATGDQRAKFAMFKRISNRIAEMMADFTARMKPEIPILRDSLYSALDAYGRTILMVPDLDTTGSNRKILNDALGATDLLEQAILPNQERINSLRKSIAGLPKVTSQFIRARRAMLEVLDDYLVDTERALNLIPEIKKSIQDILGSINSESESDAES